MNQSEKPGRLSLCVICFCAFLLLAASFVAFFGWNSARFDVVSYWDAALRLRNAQPLYSAGPVDTQAKAFIYPPTFAAVFAPFTLVPPIWGFAFWHALQLLLLPVLLFLCAQLANNGKEPVDLIQISALILLVTLAPLLANSMEGQTNIVVVTLVAGGFVMLNKARVKGAAFLFALATQLKVIPCVIILALLLARKYRECAWFAVFLGGLSLLPGLWLIPRLGFAAALQVDLSFHADFFRYVIFPGVTHQTIAGAEQLFAPNYSFYATFCRLFADGVPLTPFSSQPSSPLLFALPRDLVLWATAAVGISLFFLAARRRIDPTVTGVLFYIAGTFLNPSCWEHHLIALSLLVAILSRERPKHVVFLCLPIITLLTIPSLTHIGAILMQTNDPGLSDITSKYSLPMFAAFVLWFGVLNSSAFPERRGA